MFSQRLSPVQLEVGEAIFGDSPTMRIQRAQFLESVLGRFKARILLEVPPRDMAGSGKKAVDSRTAVLVSKVILVDTILAEVNYLVPRQHFIIEATEMFLHDTNDYSQPNEIALSHAQRIVGILHMLGEEVRGAI